MMAMTNPRDFPTAAPDTFALERYGVGYAPPPFGAPANAGSMGPALAGAQGGAVDTLTQDKTPSRWVTFLFRQSGQPHPVARTPLEN